jgi:hypothetical protein
MIGGRMRFRLSFLALLVQVTAGCVFNSSGLGPSDQRFEPTRDRRAEASRRDATPELGPDLVTDSAPPDRLPLLDRALVEARVPCSGSATCPGELVCKAGYCAWPWGITYDITLVSAVVACPKPGGGNWNATPNDPNPQVQVEVDGAKSAYAQQTGQCHPTWSNATKKYVINAPSTVALRAFNAKSGGNEPLGGLTFSGMIAVDASTSSLGSLLKADGFTDLYVSPQLTALTISVVPVP